MSLLYPLNRSRTSLSSSSEHKPANMVIRECNTRKKRVNRRINTTRGQFPAQNRINQNISVRASTTYSTFHDSSAIFAGKSVIPTFDHLRIPHGFTFRKYQTSVTARVVLTDAQDRRDQEQSHETQTKIHFGQITLVVPPERSNAPRAQPPPTPPTPRRHYTVVVDQYRSADAGQ